MGKVRIILGVKVINNNGERLWNTAQRGYIIGDCRPEHVQFNIELVNDRIVARPRPSEKEAA